MVSFAVSAFTRAYLRPAHRPRTAPSLQRGSVVPAIASTRGRSDSRSARPRFAGAPLIGFVAPSAPAKVAPQVVTPGAETGLSGSHIGSLAIPRPLRRGVLRGCSSKRFTPSMAFPPSTQARLPFAPLRAHPFDAAGFASCYGLLSCTLRRSPSAGLTPHFSAQLSPHAGGLLQRWLGPSSGRTSTGESMCACRTYSDVD